MFLPIVDLELLFDIVFIKIYHYIVLVIKYPLTFINYNDTKFYKNNQANFLAAHFAKRNTKFGGGGKIGIGKRGRAKIPSPQPPSFLPARAFSFCRAKRGNQSEFRSKKVRVLFSNCDQFRQVKFFARDRRSCLGAFCLSASLLCALRKLD